MDTWLEPVGGRPPLHTILWQDESVGMSAVLVVDDLTLGPAAGGIRTRAYADLRAGAYDAAALARAMTVKCSLAGLDAGGAKAVVLDHAGLDRLGAFAALGKRVESLGGLFRTAGDLGTTRDDLLVMAEHTRFVHVEEEDLCHSVAVGLLGCLRAALAVSGAEPEGLAVLVQGCGAIGHQVATVLHGAGMRVSVCDVDPNRAEATATAVQGSVVPHEDALLADVDVVAPCAVGGVLDVPTARALRAKVVCGAANNVLAGADAERELRRRDVVLVPDVLSSAGAVADGIGRTVMGLHDRGPLIRGLEETTRRVIMQALASQALFTEVAEALAYERIDRARAAGMRR